MSWNGSDSSGGTKPIPSGPKPAAKKSPAVVKGIVAAGIVALCAAAVMFLLRDSTPTEKTPETSPKSKVIKESKPAVSTTVKKEESLQRTKNREIERKLATGELKVRNKALLLSKISCAPYEIKEQPKESDEKKPKGPQKWVNPLQAELSKYVIPGRDCDTPDGAITDEMARKWCEEKIDYKFDDTDEVLDEKKLVEEMQAEMKKYLDDGGHAQDFLMKLMERQDAESEMMHSVSESVAQYCKAGDGEMAKAAMDKYNEYLKSKGLPPIKMTRRMLHDLKVNGGVLPSDDVNQPVKKEEVSHE